jgi:nucleotide-binding universal stress UspA family protein
VPSIKKILFPVDFSQRSIGAARYVEAFAAWFDSKIMLLHVIDADETATRDSIAQQWLLSREEQLETFLADELKSFTSRRVCKIGDPTEEIIKMVRFWAPDLVMMPTHGLGFFRPSLLGSVTAKVLHDVDCPVWTAVHAEQTPPLQKITLSKVLCAVDLATRSAHVLEWAASLANQREVDLGIVHAAPILEPSPGRTPDRDLTDSLVANAKARLARLQATVGIRATVFVNAGEPHKVVECAAREFDADLLIIGRHSGDGLDGYLRQNAYRIIRESRCPVISI